MLRNDLASRGRDAAASRLVRGARAAASVVFALVLGIAFGAELAAVQMSEENRVRLAAFEYLATLLFPADTASSLSFCFVVRNEPDFAGPPEGAGRDPDPALMMRIRELVPRATPISDCPEPEGDVGTGSAVSPVIYFAGAPVQEGSDMHVPVGYTVDARGGGWMCRVGVTGGIWRVKDCLPAWISAPF